MPLWLVEVRRTLEWGIHVEAPNEEEAKFLASLEINPQDADIVDEQTICKIVEAESQTNG
jgi:hypothetical protein